MRHPFRPTNGGGPSRLPAVDCGLTRQLVTPNGPTCLRERLRLRTGSNKHGSTLLPAPETTSVRRTAETDRNRRITATGVLVRYGLSSKHFSGAAQGMLRCMTLTATVKSRTIEHTGAITCGHHQGHHSGALSSFLLIVVVEIFAGIFS